MLSEKIKNESILIKKLIEKNKNLKFYNDIEDLSLLIAPFLSLITAIMIVLNNIQSQDFILKFLFGAMFFIIGCLAFAFIVIFSLISINYLIKGNMIKENKNSNKFFNSKYITTRSNFLEFNNLYKELSTVGEKTFNNFKYDKKETKIEEIKYFYLKEEIKKMSIKNFINYYKNGFESDIKELEINRDKIINKKVLDTLEGIDYSTFNKFKDSLIEITLTLEDKTKQLAIVNEFEKIKEQYDEETINNKIAQKLNKINNRPSESKLENNKILKSI